MGMKGTESHLIAAARSGDHNAFRQLVEANAKAVFALTYRMLGSREEADDAVQETFLKAWTRLDRFDGRAAFGTWLHRIACNHCLDLLRARGRKGETSEEHHLETMADQGPDPEEHTRGGQIGREIKGALAQLSHQERTAFVLRHCEHYSIKEISQVLDTSLNNTKQAVFRAVRKLRAALAES